MPRPPREVVRLEVRLSPATHARAFAAAAADHRTLNAEIEVLILEALDARGVAAPKRAPAKSPKRRKP